jgi:8-oxo-dGTP pyrophosphatase MutT (NUDIX family)
MELQVGVKVLLKNPEGKYLFMRRSGVAGEFAKKWDMPGGRIHVGSNLSENLAREVMEETGLTMTSEPHVIAAQDIFVPRHDLHVVRITYVGTAEGEPQLSDEHTEHAWFTLAELKLMSVDELDRYVKALLEQGAIPSAIE